MKGATDGKAIAEGIRKVTDLEGDVIYDGVDGFKKALAAPKDGKSVNYVGAVAPLNFDPSGEVHEVHSGRTFAAVRRACAGANKEMS